MENASSGEVPGDFDRGCGLSCKDSGMRAEVFRPFWRIWSHDLQWTNPSKHGTISAKAAIDGAFPNFLKRGFGPLSAVEESRTVAMVSPEIGASRPGVAMAVDFSLRLTGFPFKPDDNMHR